MSKFLIKNYAKLFEPTHVLTGYRGGVPYLKLSAPYEDGIDT